MNNNPCSCFIGACGSARRWWLCRAPWVWEPHLQFAWPERLNALPGVPTLKELGASGINRFRSGGHSDDANGMARYIASETELWRSLISERGIKLENW